jgi:SAM-dependent methyltransferase
MLKFGVERPYLTWRERMLMTGCADYPDFVARFYDVIYERLRAGVDDRFYLQEIARTQNKVLEIGVGTGRFFVQALKQGADIYGIDSSGAMIERLKQKIPSEHHARVTVQNAVAMTLPGRFGLIIAPFRMFSHLIETGDQLECLERVWAHLAPGGRFIFDLYVPDLRLMLEGIKRQRDFEGEYEPGKKLIRISSAQADLVKQISRVSMEFIWDEGEERKAEWQFDMRFFFRYELEHLIRLSRLQLETIYGDFSKNSLTKDSKDFVVMCRRA